MQAGTPGRQNRQPCAALRRLAVALSLKQADEPTPQLGSAHSQVQSTLPRPVVVRSTAVMRHLCAQEGLPRLGGHLLPGPAAVAGRHGAGRAAAGRRAGPAAGGALGGAAPGEVGSCVRWAGCRAGVPAVGPGAGERPGSCRLRAGWEVPPLHLTAAQPLSRTCLGPEASSTRPCKLDDAARREACTSLAGGTLAPACARHEPHVQAPLQQQVMGSCMPKLLLPAVLGASQPGPAAAVLHALLQSPTGAPLCRRSAGRTAHTFQAAHAPHALVTPQQEVAPATLCASVAGFAASPQAWCC